MIIHIKQPKSKRYRIKKVRSYKSIPFNKKDKSPKYNVGGFLDGKDTIYITPKTSPSELEHERYHAMMKHGNVAMNVDSFIKQELNANLYAYKKTNNPKHILPFLRYLFNDSVKYIYNEKPSIVINKIKQTLEDIDAPKEWLDDYNKLKKEYDIVYKS